MKIDQKSKQAELVYIYKGVAKTVATGPWPVMQWKKSALQKEPQYNSGLLQVRNIGAKEFQPVLTKKI